MSYDLFNLSNFKKEVFFRANLYKNQNVKSKYSIFFILSASANIKIHKTNFEADCSYKGCNQLLL